MGWVGHSSDVGDPSYSLPSPHPRSGGPLGERRHPCSRLAGAEGSHLSNDEIHSQTGIACPLVRRRSCCSVYRDRSYCVNARVVNICAPVIVLEFMYVSEYFCEQRK